MKRPKGKSAAERERAVDREAAGPDAGGRVTTRHFNGLSEAEQERLVILAEECGETVQIICKILRHGYESRNPKLEDSETNRQGLERELGDLLYAVLLMEEATDVSMRHITKSRRSKAARILPYLHHQRIPQESGKP